MITYEQIKIWCQEKENQKNLLIAGCFVIIFLVGFGAGNFVKHNKQKTAKTYPNNSTQTAKKPVVLGAQTVDGGEAIVEQPKAEQVNNSTTQVVNCPIKGNIASGGKKIYHMKGGSFYNRVKEEMCFNTETEAKGAGFVKSSK
jgi:hypothetical protein